MDLCTWGLWGWGLVGRGGGRGLGGDLGDLIGLGFGGSGFWVLWLALHLYHSATKLPYRSVALLKFLTDP